jgi:hypothetical protein
MLEELKTFEAVFADWTGSELRIVTMRFLIEDESDALVIAHDIAPVKAPS